MSYVGRMTRFGDAVRQARTRLGWSQDELAADLGIVRKTVSRWETGAIDEPQLSQLRQLIEVTGAPAEDLLRSVGLLPDDGAPARFRDPDVQAIWDLGERRNWPEDLRLQMIDLWRGRQLRETDDEAATLAAMDAARAEEATRDGQAKRTSRAQES
jgi:transcriptional regulator with XRE-family HTH domain